MNKKLFLLCGVPGSGKSTWAANQLAANGDGIIISRDAVRFSIIKDDEEYFSHEDEVFNKWIEQINMAISIVPVSNIYVDATHISRNSRYKTLSKLKLDKVDIIPVWFNMGVTTCLDRNDNRTGRAFVPKSVIRRMSEQAQAPSHGEVFKYKDIIEVTE